MPENKKMHAMHQIIYIAKAHHAAIDARIGSNGLHRSESMVLKYLADLGKSSSQKELADKFRISSPAMATTIERLVSDGYVTRSSDGEDRRRNSIKITEKGLETVKTASIAIGEVDKMTFGGLSDEEIDRLSELLDRIGNNFTYPDEFKCAKEDKK